MQITYVWSQLDKLQRFYIFVSCYVCFMLSAMNVTEATPFVPWVNGTPSESQASALPPVPIRPKISFQTRISQATLPILEGLFYKVVVHYKGLLSTGDCEERFERVRVFDSVLNLELGLNARCDFARAITQRSELELELCFYLEDQTVNAEESTRLNTPCFNQTVKVSSVPYAIKVNHAKEAQSTHQANLAYLSSYAYRVVDQSFRQANEEIPPYLSFRTQEPNGLGLDALRLSSQDEVAREALAEAGYVRWHPREEGQDHAFYLARDPFAYLDRLTLAARVVTWYGPHGPIALSQAQSELEEESEQVALSIRENLVSKGDVELVTGRSVNTFDVQVGQGALIEKGGLYVDGGGIYHGSLYVSGGLEQGWQPPTLSNSSVPHYEVKIAQDGLFVNGPLTLIPLIQQEGMMDETSHLETGSVVIHGPTRFQAYASSTSTSSDTQLSILHDLQVNGRSELNAGAFRVAQNFTLDGDVEVFENLNLGSTLSLLRSGSPQTTLTLTHDMLALNYDPNDLDATPYFDEIVVRSDVHFAHRVTFDKQVQNIGAECVITDARILDGEDQDKPIPNVYDLNCQGVSIRVSGLLESECGNGIREGEELCDDGPDYFIGSVTSYCDPSSTPFDNCRFFRLFDPNDQYICERDGTLNLSPSHEPGTISFKTQPFHGQCALQSEEFPNAPFVSDQERFIIGAQTFCRTNNCLAQVNYPDQFCRADCSFTRCGDGIVDELEGNFDKEECDDGNLVENDDCDNRCKYVSSCKLDVVSRIEQRSELIPVNTAVPTHFPPEDEQRYYSTARCNQAEPNQAPQRVVEVDLIEPTWLAFETYPDTTLDAGDPTRDIPPEMPLVDTFLYLRQTCDQINSTICNDDGGVNNYSSIAARLYEPGRHYVVVSGYNENQGKALLGVKMTCAEQEKLIATVHHKATDASKDLVFQTDTSSHNALGHVQTACLMSTLPENFVQPSDPAFNPLDALTGYGMHQVVIELVLEERSVVSVSADSLSIDPVIYVKSGCESKDTLRSSEDVNRLLCNDNATGNPLFPRATIEETLNSGVYYIVIDGDSLQGGSINISLNITSLNGSL